MFLFFIRSLMHKWAQSLLPITFIDENILFGKMASAWPKVTSRRSAITVVSHSPAHQKTKEWECLLPRFFQ
jgi:hypothetical protein